MQEGNTSSESPLLELRDVGKAFGAVVANDGISCTVGRGEILGILGENGAGKSTLMNIVSGLIPQDSGDILIDGNVMNFASPRDADAQGIGMVHQHFMLVPALTVAENFMLGVYDTSPIRLPTARVTAEIRDIGETVGMRIDPSAKVSDLGIGDQQRVEIIRALHGEARILIFDEPTTVLTVEERDRLFKVIRALSDRGSAIILISHKLDDIFAICNKVMVLRRGKVVHAAPIEACTPELLVEAMVGADVSPPARRSTPAAAAIVAEVDKVAVTASDGRPVFQDVSFKLHAGEILALAGVEGNGQRELAEIMAGLRKPASGVVSLFGEPGTARPSPRRRREQGLRHVPEDRLGSGVLLDQPLSENHLLSHFFRRPYARGGWVSRRQAKRSAARLIRDFDVKAQGPGDLMASLSGGNQQKLVLGRELDGETRLLIAAHPTRGLDMRTVAFMQERLLDLRDQGVGILLISSDLEEIWQVADRIMVLSNRKLHGPARIDETTIRDVGAWMSDK